MKILFQSYNTCCQNASGGVQNRIKRIHDLLVKRGIEVDYFSTFNTKIANYDLIHVFMLHEDNFSTIRYAKNNKIPVVISSIASLDSAHKVDFYHYIVNKLPISTTYQLMELSANMADILIAETPRERDFLIDHYHQPKEKIRVIPNGTDNFYPGDHSIYSYIGGNKKYILQVGRFDENKNQLNVIKAVEGTDLNLVLIGGPSNKSSRYYDTCRKIADRSKNIFMLGWLSADSSLLRSAYTHADTVILPSFNETFGLVALEGIMSESKLVISKNLPIRDFESISKVPCFAPNRIDEIRTVLQHVSRTRYDHSIKKRICEEFSWEKVIDDHIKCYKSLL